MEPHPLFSAFIGAAYKNRKAACACAAIARRAAVLARRLSIRRIRYRPSAGADRRALRDRERGARPFPRGRDPRSRWADSSSRRRSIRPIAAAWMSYRGPGLQRRSADSGRPESAKAIPILTDIHEPAQAEPAAEVVDILQIPAFLCRQTDLLIEAGRTGRIVNIKKGQFVAPHDIRHAADKVASTGQQPDSADRARLVLRLQQSGGGHARACDHARVRVAGDLRCHA